MDKLKTQDIWINWSKVEIKDKPGEFTKMPINPITGYYASTSNPKTWSSYENAVHRKGFGVGFVFTRGLCGIDIDKIETAEDKERANSIIAFMDTYTERSPSGKGYHILFYIDFELLPPDFADKYKQTYYQRKGAIECYVGGLTNRYFTYTGDSVCGDTIKDCTEKFLIFLDGYMLRDNKPPPIDGLPPKEKPPPIDGLPPKEKPRKPPKDILKIIRNSRSGAKFAALYDNGDLTPYNNNHSSADLALCNILAFFTGGNELDIDCHFSNSALYRKKWDRADYKHWTITRAIESCNGRFYTGRASHAPTNNKPSAKKNDEENILTINIVKGYLEAYKITLRYNEITREVKIDGLSKKNIHEQTLELLPVIIYDQLKIKYKKCFKSDIVDALNIIAMRNRYNPVLDYIKGVKWDGVDRLPQLYQALNITDEFHKVLIKKWLMQCIAMAMNDMLDPFGADGVLVLQGKQGIGKTSFVRKISMLPEFCALGQFINANDKDTIRRCTSNWIVELGEIDRQFQYNIEWLKAFITDAKDSYRLPYGRTDMKMVRHTSFIGTCNEIEYLVDKTGNRRFWTVPINTIDIELLNELDTVQLWAGIYKSLEGNIQGFRLTANEQLTLNEANKVHERPLKAEAEVRDILFKAQINPLQYEFVWTTVTEFKMHNEILRAYSVQQIGEALTRVTGEEATTKKINGKANKMRILPKFIINI